MKTIIFILMLFGGIFLGKSQQLVYKPINPAFGGDTFNYQWLLSSANAQNQFDQKNDFASLLNDVNSLDSFSQSLNRQVLSELSRKLFQDQFGEGSLQPGNYLFGSMYLQVTSTAQGLLINILDTSTGEQSEIIIPK
ncbi:curli production assembly/transport component CsgF [Chryseobacterium arachidis]|uniref:Curli production assembly/transport component CsgF n=1 Tax=Chryseobacterium arachidis TaxID=1416778 RepID=A0A1M4SZD3_9FLAO|nr:curli production assembly/transport component CsgF [Chryseobacterium arachidis]SHE37520.1 curli production assembly/transport component CsgF [Chryseobacterium arachidis]